MGIWKEISLLASPFSTNSHSPSVSSYVKMIEGGGNAVKMNISIAVRNYASQKVKGVARIESEGVFAVLEQEVELNSLSDTLV